MAESYKTCTCGRTEYCNLTDCPNAQGYRDSVQPRWYERLIGAVIAFLMGRW